MAQRLHRREALKVLGGMAGVSLLAACSSPSSAPAAPAKPAAEAKPGESKPAEKAAAPAAAGAVFEIVHWYPMTASDGEVWKQVIDNFNAVHKDKGLQIRSEVVPSEQYGTKLLASSTTGDAPDFGWGEGLGRREWVNKGVMLPIDDLAKQAGLDLNDFTDGAIQGATYDGKLYGVPMDNPSFQMLINLDHVKEAGLDESKPPADGAQLLEWATKTTRRSGDTVTRAGFLMTGSGLHINLVWGVVAHQMGFRQFSDDYKQAMINPDAAKAAAQWTLDILDQHKVGSRDVADRYKAFGTGEGTMFWTGPWTLAGYVQQNLNFATAVVPAVGKERATRGEQWNLEMYVQRDKNRHEQTIKALKWLSDETFLWSTKGRGITTRKSVLNRPEYRTAAYDPKVWSAFIDGAQYATFRRPPIVATQDFNVYTGTGLVAKVMDPVWAKQTGIDDALKQLGEAWQKGLDAG